VKQTVIRMVISATTDCGPEKWIHATRFCMILILRYCLTLH